MRYRLAFRHAILTILAGLLLAVACSRTQEPIPQAPAPSPPFEYLGEWGEKGDGPGQLSRPEWIALDPAGNVYVADSRNGYIHKFSPQGHPLLSFHDGVPKNPDGVAIDRGGAIYVIAPPAASVSIFKPEGERMWGFPLRPVLRHQWPAHLVVDDDGNIYAIAVLGDSGRRELRKYTVRGRLLKSWSMHADADSPVFVPAAMGFGRDQSLYVVDFTGTRIQKFTRDGDFIIGWGKPEASQNLEDRDRVYSGYGIGVTEKYVFAADSEIRGVRVWTLEGEEKLTDDLGGRLHQDAGKFQIAISSRGELLALDSNGARILRFRINF